MLFPDSAGLTRTVFPAGFPGRSMLLTYLPGNNVRFPGTQIPLGSFCRGKPGYVPF